MGCLKTPLGNFTVLVIKPTQDCQVPQFSESPNFKHHPAYHSMWASTAWSADCCTDNIWIAACRRTGSAPLKYLTSNGTRRATRLLAGSH